MPRYLLSLYRPNGYDPASAEDDTMRAAISTVNAEMVAEGVRVFVGGLHPPGEAVTARPGDDRTGEIIRNTPTAKGRHLGGLWVLEVDDDLAAESWAIKAAEACRGDVELRKFY